MEYAEVISFIQCIHHLEGKLKNIIFLIFPFRFLVVIYLSYISLMSKF